MIGSTLLAALLQGAVLMEEPFDALRPRIETAPQDVSAFIERRTGCNQLRSEAGGGDAARARQVRRMLVELRCDRMEADEQALRTTHHDKPEVLKLLTETRGLMPW